VALYLLDWDGGGRSERVDVVDAVSGKVLDSRTARRVSRTSDPLTQVPSAVFSLTAFP
jgi:hypothetical protein